MAKGSKENRRGDHRFEVEWVTVSYRTIQRWLVVLVVVGLVGGGIALKRHLGASTERAEIERLITLADRMLQTLQAEARPSDIEPAAGQLSKARERLAEDDLAAARTAAENARRLLQELEQATIDLARLLMVEGDVQVKSVGALDWIKARQGSPLRPGDLLKTGVDSAARVSNVDDSVHTLTANTLMRISRSTRDEASGRTDVAVEITAGRLTIESEEQAPGSKSEVKTPNVSANVESNTTMGVAFDERSKRSQVDVVEGRARVRMGDTVVDLGGSERVLATAEGIERRRLPGVPRPTAPPMHKLILLEELNKRALELEWESARDARAYRVELGKSPLFTKLIRTWDSHAATFVAAGQLPVGRYYWRVTALDRDGIDGGWSRPHGFRISDVVPDGDPPPLSITGYEALGEGVFLFEGKTRVGVILSIDDGSRVTYFQPQQSGAFRQILTIPYEGTHVVTVTARDSRGLEREERVRIEVQLP